MTMTNNWFGGGYIVKPTTAVRMVRFGNAARGMVPGTVAIFDTVNNTHVVPQKQVRQPAHDVVLRLVTETE